MLHRTSLAAALLAMLAGCQAARPGPPPSAASVTVELQPQTRGWSDVIRPTDAARLSRIDAAWTDALDEARRAGQGRRIAAQGALLEPNGALPRAELAPGVYHCRIFRLGGSDRRRAFTAFEPYFCHVGVEGDMLSLTKTAGSERQGGYLWADGPNRMIFLGAVARGAETSPLAYGESEERNMAGVLERVGPFHYRLVMPWRQAATLDVLELVPALPPDLPMR